MKRILAALALLVTAACASSSSPAPARVSVNLVQLTGVSDVQPVGPFDVQFGISVQNRSNEPLMLRRVELQQIGTGAYVLTRNQPYLFKRQVAPGATENVAFWAHAYTYVRPGDLGASEPVNLRATIFFDSPTGPFRQVIHQILGQFGE